MLYEVITLVLSLTFFLPIGLLTYQYLDRTSGNPALEAHHAGDLVLSLGVIVVSFAVSVWIGRSSSRPITPA